MLKRYTWKICRYLYMLVQKWAHTCTYIRARICLLLSQIYKINEPARKLVGLHLWFIYRLRNSIHFAANASFHIFYLKLCRLSSSYLLPITICHRFSFIYLLPFSFYFTAPPTFCPGWQIIFAANQHNVQNFTWLSSSPCYWWNLALYS